MRSPGFVIVMLVVASVALGGWLLRARSAPQAAARDPRLAAGERARSHVVADDAVAKPATIEHVPDRELEIARSGIGYAQEPGSGVRLHVVDATTRRELTAVTLVASDDYLLDRARHPGDATKLRRIFESADSPLWIDRRSNLPS